MLDIMRYWGRGEDSLFPPLIVIVAAGFVVPARESILLLVYLVEDVVSFWRDTALAGFGAVAGVVHVYCVAHFVDEDFVVLWAVNRVTKESLE